MKDVTLVELALQVRGEPDTSQWPGLGKECLGIEHCHADTFFEIDKTRFYWKCSGLEALGCCLLSEDKVLILDSATRPTRLTEKFTTLSELAIVLMQ